MAMAEEILVLGELPVVVEAEVVVLDLVLLAQQQDAHALWGLLALIH
jgi:hypothetical protein